jgi:hypothetical protein
VHRAASLQRLPTGRSLRRDTWAASERLNIGIGPRTGARLPLARIETEAELGLSDAALESDIPMIQTRSRPPTGAYSRQEHAITERVVTNGSFRLTMRAGMRAHTITVLSHSHTKMAPITTGSTSGENERMDASNKPTVGNGGHAGYRCTTLTRVF